MNRKLFLFISVFAFAGICFPPGESSAAIGSYRSFGYDVSDCASMCELADKNTLQYLQDRNLTHIVLALKAVRHARLADPESGKPHVCLVRIHEALNQKDLAREQLELEHQHYKFQHHPERASVMVRLQPQWDGQRDNG